MNAVPLQAVDSFLIQFNVGDALLLVTILGAIGTLLVKRSMKLFAIHLISMGVLLVILPASMLAPSASSFLPAAAAYKAVGLVLAVLSPVIFTVSKK